ncbi:hypothetical protein ACFTAO_02365 [Paenibacillus rhizoplanae]
MGNSKAGKRFMMAAVLVLSLAVSGISGAAAGIKTMKKRRHGANEPKTGRHDVRLQH